MNEKIIKKFDEIYNFVKKENNLIFDFKKESFEEFLNWCCNLKWNKYLDKNFKKICLRDIYWFFWFKDYCTYEKFCDFYDSSKNYKSNELFSAIQFIKLIYKKHKEIKVYKFEKPDYIIVLESKVIGLEITEFYHLIEYNKRAQRKIWDNKKKNIEKYNYFFYSNDSALSIEGQNELISSVDSQKKNIQNHVEKKEIYLKNIKEWIKNKKTDFSTFEIVIFVNSWEGFEESLIKKSEFFFETLSKNYSIRIIWLYSHRFSGNQFIKIFGV
ncbi:MAG: hypothetical protein K2H56_03040 [Malacoplasma sp.]|nr:hypothetical protein [Malacoplasma sp.]